MIKRTKELDDKVQRFIDWLPDLEMLNEDFNNTNFENELSYYVEYDAFEWDDEDYGIWLMVYFNSKDDKAEIQHIDLHINMEEYELSKELYIKLEKKLKQL